MEINSQYGKTKIVVHRKGGMLPRNLKFYLNGTELEIRGAIKNYVDFCCRIFILHPIASCFSQNKVLS